MEIPTWEEGERLEFIIDGSLRSKALDYLESKNIEPAEPKLAATVMLVRDALKNHSIQLHSQCPWDVEVFMLRRRETMSFMPTAAVFPGGSIDMRDADEHLPWIGPSPATWAERMSCSEEIARCVVSAAVREVFEECGLLLAGADETTTVNDLSDEIWVHARQDLVNHTRSLTELLLEQRLVLRSDLLGLQSRWVTPKFEPRRFDTYFFTALVPEGQTPDANTTEASAAGWVNPHWILRKAKEESILLLPPTQYNLSRIAVAESAEKFVLETPELRGLELEPLRKEDGTVVLQCMLP